MSMEPKIKAGGKGALRLELRKAVLDWLWSRRTRPDGLAFDMGMFRKTDHVDIAAAWLGRGGSGVSGRVFICCPERKDCWPSCSVEESIMAEIVSLKEEREKMEAGIRATEPGLREEGLLFDELAIWDYAHSVNQEYHELCARLASLEAMLYNGTCLQHILEHPLCSRLYVVVPEGVLQTAELLEGWGLLWMKADGSLREMREAKRHAVSPVDEMLFLKRIMNCNALARKAFLELKVSSNKEKKK
ncbi:MAG: hypothetical protein IKS20_02165 [Victivallales bacterium]|nr:hypothetical protein [Victivallales bacterium]